VRTGDVKGLAEGLMFLLDNPAQGGAIGKRGRNYALRHHSIERLTAEVDRLYRSLLAKEQEA
jgi:glycosyltransferase involved in cell wall biosynthesis